MAAREAARSALEQLTEVLGARQRSGRQHRILEGPTVRTAPLFAALRLRCPLTLIHAAQLELLVCPHRSSLQANLCALMNIPARPDVRRTRQTLRHVLSCFYGEGHIFLAPCSQTHACGLTAYTAVAGGRAGARAAAHGGGAAGAQAHSPLLQEQARPVRRRHHRRAAAGA